MLLNKHRIWGSWGLIGAVTNCFALWFPSSWCLWVPKAGDLHGPDVLVLRVSETGARPWVSARGTEALELAGDRGRAGAPAAPGQGAAPTEVCLAMEGQGDLSGGGAAAARGSQRRCRRDAQHPTMHGLSRLGQTAPLGTPGCRPMRVPLV